MSAFASESRMPDVGDVIADKFRIDTVLGHGGMGVVYAATNRLTDKRVAIKMLLPQIAVHRDMAERFVREAKASARIAHRNVVDIYDVGEHAGSTFLVMELLVGMSLADYLDLRKTIPLPETMAILAHVCRGVAAAHAKGVVHRDLKPDNIFLRRDERGEPVEPKVLDFGISKLLDAGATIGIATGTGQSMGTPFYMPPEQMTGAREVTRAADVYSIGVVIFRCLTGQYQYAAENVATLAIKQHSEAPRTLFSLRPDLGPEISRALERALAPVPTDRYQTIEELVAAFASFGLADCTAKLPQFSMPDRLSLIRHIDDDLASSPTALADGTPRLPSSGMRPAARRRAAESNRWGVVAGARRTGIAIGLALIALAAGAYAIRSLSASPPDSSENALPESTAAATEPSAVPGAADTETLEAGDHARTAVELSIASEPAGVEVVLEVFERGASSDEPTRSISLGTTPVHMALAPSELPRGARLEFRFAREGRAPIVETRVADGRRIDLMVALDSRVP